MLPLAPAHAATEQQETEGGHGHYSISYQYISVDGFESSTGKLPIGTVDTHSVNFDVEYALSGKWTVAAGIPLVRKRYRGPGPHDPLTLEPPRPDVENVDRGDWNTAFQDVHLGVRYLARGGSFRIEPFTFLGWPSHDYPFFGHAAVGQNLWKLEVGSSFTYFPPISDAYYRLNLGYVFVEETLGFSIDHWLMRAEAGYFFSPRLSGRVFVLHKDGHGLKFPDDFPPPRTSELWYQHDRLVKHNYTNVGVGLDWALGDEYRVSSSLMTMTRAEQVHIMEYAITVALSRSF